MNLLLKIETIFITVAGRLRRPCAIFKPTTSVRQPRPPHRRKQCFRVRHCACHMAAVLPISTFEFHQKLHNFMAYVVKKFRAKSQDWH
jgi:hypothetical protein